MKRLLVLCFIVFLILCLSGCFLTPRKGIRIVGISETNRSNKAVGSVMRERYVFSYPENCAAYMLVAEDLEGNILTEGVEWSLADPTLGKLIPEPEPNDYIQCFMPERTGETIVKATKDGVSDTAQIIVYPGWGSNSRTWPGPNHGFDFSKGEFTIDESEADIWWPVCDQERLKFRFECGYWTDTNIIALIDNLDALTAEGKELISGPIDYSYYASIEQLFLVRTREGAVYAAIVAYAKLVYKPTPLIPAP